MIYLDHAATTPLRPEARTAMEPFLSDRFGNAASSHAAGRRARAALEEARERVAASLGASRSEVVFTSGGTEADHLAVVGRWRAGGGGVAVSAIEHSAVREAASQAAREGAPVTVMAVREDGRLDPGALEEALLERPAVVSVMWGNNEVGTLQPVAEVAELCRAGGASFHTDAVQAVGHIPVSVDALACDFLSISAHKFGGPQGVGALYVRSGAPLEALVRGGGQEGGRRGGTSNVAGAVGLAAALERATAELGTEPARLAGLRDGLERTLCERVGELRVNGSREHRLPHILNVGLDGVEPDVVLSALDVAGVAVSSGSACHSGAAAPSHVMVAMGVRSDTTLRFSLGWSTTEAEVDHAAATVTDVIERARAVEAGR